MNKKVIYRLLIAFGALLVLFYVQKSFRPATTSPKSLSELSLDFDKDKVVRIDVFKQDYPDSGLHFQRLESGWVLTNEYSSRARESDIDKLLDDLHQANGSIRGESADLYGDFDISDERALQIEFYGPDESKLVHLYIGKGGGGKDCFIRAAGSPVVYLVDNNFISRFGAWGADPFKKLPTDRWLELSLCEIQKDNLTSMKIHRDKKDYEFALLETPSEDSLAPPVKIWKQITPQKGATLEESKIKGLHSSLSGLRAAGVDDPGNKSKFGLDKPRFTVWFADMTGSGKNIVFSNEINDGGDRYALVDGSDTVYKVNKGSFERIFVTPFETTKK